MFRKLRTILHHHPVDSTNLGLFRIGYSVYLLLEALQLIFYYPLIFDSSYHFPIPPSIHHLLLLIWPAVIFLLMIGLWTPLVTVINYIFSLFYFTTSIAAAYQAPCVSLGINLLFIFIPVNASLSIDSILARKNGRHIDHNVESLYYYGLVLFSLGFVYVESVLWKLISPLWQKGLSLWAGASYLPVTCYDMTPLINHEGWMRLLCYFAIAFEATFIFVFMRKRWRWPVAFTGVLLHLCIMAIFPIRLFGLQFAIFYLLILPVSFGFRLRKRFEKVVEQIVRFIYKLPIPEWKKPFGSFRLFKLVLIALLIYQLLFLAIASPITRSTTKKMASKSLFIQSVTQFIFSRNPICIATGIINHPLFLDDHFVRRNVYKIEWVDSVGKAHRLPMVEDNGLCNPYIDGIVWKRWEIGTLHSSSFEETIRTFINYYELVEGRWMNSTHYSIYKKEIFPPHEFEKDFLKKQLDQPWIKMATFAWKDPSGSRQPVFQYE